MEAAFRQPLGHVRVHTDAQAGTFTEAVSAEAATVGPQIAFAPNRFRPGTESGDHLLAHEVAHVVQHGSSEPAALHGFGIPSQAAEPGEMEAERAADRVVSGGFAQVVPGRLGISTRSRILRRARAGAATPISAHDPALAAESAVAAELAVAEQGERRKRKRQRGVAEPPVPAPKETAAAGGEPSAPSAVVPPAEAPGRPAPTPLDLRPGENAAAPPITPAAPKSVAPASPSQSAPAAETAAATRVAAAETGGKPAPTVVGEPAVQADIKADEADEAAAVAEEAAATGSAVVAADEAGIGAEAGAGAAAAPAAASPAPQAEAPAAETPTEGAPEAGTEAEGEGGAAAPAAAPSPQSAAEDPAFQATMARVRAVARRQGHNNAARKKAAEAQAAAKGPPNEKEAKAAGSQVEKMDAKEPAPFETQTFEEALRAKIREVAPTNLKEMETFKASGKMNQVKGAATGEVQRSTEAAAGPIATATEETPDASAQEAKEVTPLAPFDPGPAPGGVGAEAAAPKPKADAEIAMDDGPRELDQQMADSNVTEEQLENSNEPDFQNALGAKRDAEKDAAEAPERYRGEERQQVEGAQSRAAQQAETGLGEMHGSRAEQFGAVFGGQQEAQSEEEQTRATIAADIQAIYDETKSKVTDRLARLDEDVNAAFDAGADAAIAAATDHVNDRIFYYKLDRYLSIPVVGQARWIRDQFLDLPSEVEAFYTEGQAVFFSRMDGVISDVSSKVDTGLQEAKDEIATGRQRVADYVADLDASVRSIGETVAGNFQRNFDDLAGEVDSHRDQLIESLAQRYAQSLETLNQRFDEIHASNRGFVSKAADALAGVIETIKKLKEMLLSVASSAAAAIEQIIKDPIGFLGNLIAGIKQGVSGFLGNIVGHLKRGLMGWLFGTLASAGIQLPETFDLKGIIGLILQVMGLTYANFRARAVAIVGEPIVKAMETAVEIFVIVIREGVGGLWRWIKEQVGNLKDMLLEEIQSWVITKVITAGITWILSLLNPASAFVRAVKMIIDVVMFFINRGSQIMALVSAVVQSLAAIASGSIGALASAVEGALARAIPVTISFLASLLGLGGIASTIQGFIQKLQAPVNKAIDWVIGKAVKLAKKIGGLFGGKKKGETSPTEDRQDLDDVKNAARDAVLTRLGGEATVDETQQVLGQVHNDLRHLGLRSLTLGPDQDGERAIFAEASEKKRIAAIARKRVTVAVSAKIVVEGETVLQGMERRGERTAAFAQFSGERAEAIGGSGRAALLPEVSQPPRTAAKKGSQPSSGLILEPASASRELEVVAWNTGQPNKEHNTSHAERQFVEWFEGRPPSWRNRVISIVIAVEGRKVCSVCETDLKRLHSLVRPGTKISWPGSADLAKQELEVESH